MSKEEKCLLLLDDPALSFKCKLRLSGADEATQKLCLHQSSMGGTREIAVGIRNLRNVRGNYTAVKVATSFSGILCL
jgi:hypothetical protein